MPRCVISGFRRHVNEVLVLLGFTQRRFGEQLPTGCPETPVSMYQSALRKIP